MNKNFSIIVSEFNKKVTEHLFNSAFSYLIQSGVPEKKILVAKVPGAIEIPLIAKMLAKRKKCSAIICLGAVIRGDTDHYKYVCDQVSQGCQWVMLKYDIPVIFGVLTTETEEQAFKRTDGTVENKGADAAAAALKMVKLIDKITLGSSDDPDL